MKKENIILNKLLQEIINEVGDLKNISGYDYDLNNDGGIFYFEYENQKLKCKVSLTEVPSQINVSFKLPPIINQSNKPIISVGFDIEGTDEQYLKSDYGLLLKILKTVVNIVKDLMPNYPENTIFIFMATSKTGEGFNDPQKMKLYKLILQQNIPLGYRMGDGNFVGNQLIFLTKK